MAQVSFPAKRKPQDEPKYRKPLTEPRQGVCHAPRPYNSYWEVVCGPPWAGRHPAPWGVCVEGCSSKKTRVFPTEEVCGLRLLYHPWYFFSVTVHTIEVIISAFADRFIPSAIRWACKVSGTISDSVDTKKVEADSTVRMTPDSGQALALVEQQEEFSNRVTVFETQSAERGWSFLQVVQKWLDVRVGRSLPHAVHRSNWNGSVAKLKLGRDTRELLVVMETFYILFIVVVM